MFNKINRVKIICKNTNQCIAYMRTGDAEMWRDPYGGIFSLEQKKQLSEVFAGNRTEIMLDRLYDSLRVISE